MGIHDHALTSAEYAAGLRALADALEAEGLPASVRFPKQPLGINLVVTSVDAVKDFALTHDLPVTESGTHTRTSLALGPNPNTYYDGSVELTVSHIQPDEPEAELVDHESAPLVDRVREALDGEEQVADKGLELVDLSLAGNSGRSVRDAVGSALDRVVVNVHGATSPGQGLAGGGDGCVAVHEDSSSVVPEAATSGDVPTIVEANTAAASANSSAGRVGETPTPSLVQLNAIEATAQGVLDAAEAWLDASDGDDVGEVMRLADAVRAFRKAASR